MVFSQHQHVTSLCLSALQALSCARCVACCRLCLCGMLARRTHVRSSDYAQVAESAAGGGVDKVQLYAACQQEYRKQRAHIWAILPVQVQGAAVDSQHHLHKDVTATLLQGPCADAGCEQQEHDPPSSTSGGQESGLARRIVARLLFLVLESLTVASCRPWKERGV